MTMRALFAAAFSLAASSYAFSGPLPGGAESLVETYQDWVIACEAPEGDTICLMRQVQSSTQTGQHVLTAEFRAGADGGIEGALLLPFGLALAQGISLAIDEQPGPRLAFSTCLPNGCIAPVRFEASTIADLEAGNVLRAAAVAANSAQPVAFDISLRGFTAALGRMTELIS
ncbi:invasion associated locus B family protein [Pelagibacterium sediminicola]|uniref:invasion associated locus B family protein n=1 Tax=Pelagibacterium sediminicola TaxID=2248761 RepID=UPI000E30F0E0|nr:invasion associated locus B family protein [Pelagibacterium sediminicola]